MANNDPQSVGDAPDQFHALRVKMVDTQVRRRDIHDERVLNAMTRVPRHEFVPAALRDAAYTDHALPIGCCQSISQPLMVATMCQAAELRGDEQVLEIGTGSGYGAAVLAELAAEVHTVERIAELACRAAETLDRLGYENVSVHLASESLGCPDAGPFDAIIVTAGATSMPKSLLEQLDVGGRVIIPIGQHEHRQTMYRVRLNGARAVFENLGGCAFVPLIGDYGEEDGLL